MLDQRKYIILEQNQERILAKKPDTKQMVVFFADSPKFNVKNIQMLIKILGELKIFHAIIVYKNDITSFTKKIVEQSVEMELELFAEEDLEYNITKHKFQPIFQRLGTEKATNFIQKYGQKFATLMVTDPIARFYLYKKGDVIKITRDKYVTYRIVK